MNDFSRRRFLKSAGAVGLSLASYTIFSNSQVMASTNQHIEATNLIQKSPAYHAFAEYLSKQDFIIDISTIRWSKNDVDQEQFLIFDANPNPSSAKAYIHGHIEKNSLLISYSIIQAGDQGYTEFGIYTPKGIQSVEMTGTATEIINTPVPAELREYAEANAPKPTPSPDSLCQPGYSHTTYLPWFRLPLQDPIMDYCNITNHYYVNGVPSCYISRSLYPVGYVEHQIVHIMYQDRDCNIYVHDSYMRSRNIITGCPNMPPCY